MGNREMNESTKDLPESTGSSTDAGKQMTKSSDNKSLSNNKDKKGKKKFSGKKHNGNKDKKEPRKKFNGNDVSWYKNYPDLFLLATEVQKFKVTGRAQVIRSIIPSLEVRDPETVTNGGIVRLSIQPTVGLCLDASDPINKMSLSLFNAIRGRYTSTVPFQPSDLSAVVIAFGSVIACISEIKRDLSLVNQTYPLDNASFPDLIAEATCINLSDLRHNYASYLYQLDMQINRLNMIRVPGSFDYFKKMGWAARFIYVDDYAQSRGNYFVQRWAYFYQFRSDVNVLKNFVEQSQVASGLGLIANTTTTINTVQDKLNILDKLISSLVDDDSVRQISGWMRDKLATTTVTGLDVVLGLQSPAERNEIMNVYCSNVLCDFSPMVIGSFVAQDVDNQCLVDMSTIVANTMPKTFDPLTPVTHYATGLYLTFPTAPDNDLLMEGTRGVSAVILKYLEGINAAGDYSLVKSNDVVSVIGIDYIYKAFTGASTERIAIQFPDLGINYNDDTMAMLAGSDVFTSGIIARMIQDLDFPLIAYNYITTGNNVCEIQGITQYNRNNFNFFVSYDQIHQLHSVAIWSMFHLPDNFEH